MSKCLEARELFLVEYAKKLSQTNQTMTVTINDWTSIWGTIDRKTHNFPTQPDPNINNRLNQPSFWLGSMHDFQVKGNYHIRFYPGVNNPDDINIDITDVNLTWRWVDRIDANDFREYNWKENGKIQGAIETTLGDGVGDKLLGGSYDVHVNMIDRNNYDLYISATFDALFKRVLVNPLW